MSKELSCQSIIVIFFLFQFQFPSFCMRHLSFFFFSNFCISYIDFINSFLTISPLDLLFSYTLILFFFFFLLPFFLISFVLPPLSLLTCVVFDRTTVAPQKQFRLHSGGGHFFVTFHGEVLFHVVLLRECYAVEVVSSRHTHFEDCRAGVRVRRTERVKDE